MNRRYSLAATVAVLLLTVFLLSFFLKRFAGNVPIDFWGKVTDEKGNPLEWVRVEYHYQTEHLTPAAWWGRGEIHKGQTTTNGAGLFSIVGLNGHILTIEGLAKDGYRTPQTFGVKSFNYLGDTALGRFVANKETPVHLVMLNEKVIGSLIEHGGNFGHVVRLSSDGVAIRWNLWSGRKDESGELEITLKIDPNASRGGLAHDAWESTVAMVNGGIMEAPRNESIWVAPEHGYASAVGYPKTEQTQGVPARSFYVKTSDGKFGRVEVELSLPVDDSNARCLIKTVMNSEVGVRMLAR